jgi:hypothetical protein
MILRSQKRGAWLTLESGVWIWGIALAIWLVLIIQSLLWHAFSSTNDVNNFENRLYFIIEDNNTIVASITAVLGVVWSWFLQMREKRQAKSRAS